MRFSFFDIVIVNHNVHDEKSLNEITDKTATTLFLTEIARGMKYNYGLSNLWNMIIY